MTNMRISVRLASSKHGLAGKSAASEVLSRLLDHVTPARGEKDREPETCLVRRGTGWFGLVSRRK